MSKPQTATNPFYIALVAVGILFSVTACAYCVMAFRAVQRPGQSTAVDEPAQEPALLQFLDRHGVALMGGELLALAICTFGAMAYDKRLAAAESDAVEIQPTGTEPASKT